MELNAECDERTNKYISIYFRGGFGEGDFNA
jgi:hypothetical protein